MFVRENANRKGANPPEAFVSIILENLAELRKHIGTDGKIRLTAPLWHPRESKPNGPKLTGPVNIDQFTPNSNGTANSPLGRPRVQPAQQQQPDLDDEIPF